MRPHSLVTLIFTAAAVLGGCASTDPSYGRYDGYDSRYSGDRRDNYSSGYGVARPNAGYYGVVDAIESTRGGSNDNAVAGTIIGGVIGGVIGHQIGSGTGNTVATVAGAVGGAAVGHEIGQANAGQDAYRIRIRLDNGIYQTVTQASIGNLRAGDSVRVADGRAYRY